MEIFASRPSSEVERETACKPPGCRRPAPVAMVRLDELSGFIGGCHDIRNQQDGQ
jgi:hypothetical protein